jgi:hypothetical protein
LKYAPGAVCSILSSDSTVRGVIIGMDIADPDDCFGNYEHLRAEYPKLSKVDAVSIVNVLSVIKHYND